MKIQTKFKEFASQHVDSVFKFLENLVFGIFKKVISITQKASQEQTEGISTRSVPKQKKKRNDSLFGSALQYLNNNRSDARLGSVINNLFDNLSEEKDLKAKKEELEEALRKINEELEREANEAPSSTNNANSDEDYVKPRKPFSSRK